MKTLEQLLTWEPGQYPQRLQRRRAEGWRNPRETDFVFVGRCGRRACQPGDCWGNPYTVGLTVTVDTGPVEVIDAQHAVRLFWHDLTTLTPRSDGLAAARARISQLCGKRLMCWCPLPRPGEPDWCHAAALTVLANPHPSVINPVAVSVHNLAVKLRANGWTLIKGSRHRWLWPGETRETGRPQLHTPIVGMYVEEFVEAATDMINHLTHTAERGRQAQQILDELARTALQEVPADVHS